jgi:uncharacterized protein (TIGR02001 family)
MPILFLALAALPTAQAEVTGNVAFTTDYIFRGITQTQHDPALQGGFTFTQGGFSAALWGSNVNFGSADNSSGEVDLTLSYAHQVSDAMGIDVGYVFYAYPGEETNNYGELYAGLRYTFSDMLAGSFKYYYSDDFFAETGPADYFDLSLSLTLPAETTLGLHVGYTDVEDIDFSATDWKIGVSKAFGGIGFELAYTDTDLSEDECGSDACEGRVALTASKSF